MTIKTLDELLDVAEEMNRKLPEASTKFQVQDAVLCELDDYIRGLSRLCTLAANLIEEENNDE